MPSEAETLALVRTLPPDSIVRMYVEYQYDATDCPSAFMMHNGIMLVTAAMDWKLFATLGTRVRPNLFTFIVGPSGHRKTTAVENARSILKLAGMKAYELIDPQSAGGLIRSLADRQGPHRWIPMGEAGDWLAHSAPRGHLASMRDTFTRIYDGAPIEHLRVDSKKSVARVDEHCVSILLGCTPAHLEKHTSLSDWETGFLNRFMFCYAEMERDYGDPPPYDPTGDTEIAARLSRLAALQKPKGTTDVELDDGSRGIGASCVGFDDDAVRVWRAWTKRVKARIEGYNELEQAATKRWQTHAFKLALVMSYDLGAADVVEWHIPKRAVQFATKVVDWSMADALKMVESMVGSFYERDRRAILKVFAHEASQGYPCIPYRAVALTVVPKMAQSYLQSVLASMVAETTLYTWKLGAEQVYSTEPKPKVEDTDEEDGPRNPEPDDDIPLL